MTTRICKYCNQEKPLTEFYKQRKIYYTHMCKSCKNKLSRERYIPKQTLSTIKKSPQTYDPNTPYYEIKDNKLILRYKGEKQSIIINLNCSKEDFEIRVIEIVLSKPIMIGVHPRDLVKIG